MGDVKGNQVAEAPENPYGIQWQEFFSMIQDKDLKLYHTHGGLPGIAGKLKTSLQDGLSADSVEKRRDVYGENCLPPEEEISYINFLKDALSDKMMLLLLVLGVVAIILGLSVAEGCHDEPDYKKGWVEGTFIIVAVFGVVIITTVNDYFKELKFQALDEVSSKTPFDVTRGGKTMTVDVAELVVGDIVHFSSGCHMPVDGLYISGQGVTIDESACTGENDEKKKKVSVSTADTVKEKDPFIISGTSVIAAEEGRFLCIGVGESSFSGKLEMQTRTGRMPTPLQEKLDDLADTVGRIGIAVALLLFVTLAIIMFAKAADQGKKIEWTLLVKYATTGVAIVVVAVPEGLPLSVTIALAYSMSAMLEDNNMVRSLSACETMGAATQICSDKTGTLTTNNMTQVKGWIGGEQLKPYDHNGTKSLALQDVSSVSQQAMDLFCESVAFNTTAKIIKRGGDGEKTVWGGNKTEQGILRFVDRMGRESGSGGFQGIRDRLASPDDRQIFPFQSSKKSMTTLVREQSHPIHGPSVIQYTKGASETILDNCTHYVGSDGAQVAIDEPEHRRIQSIIQAFAKEGLRTIGVAYRKYGSATEMFPEADPFEPSCNLVLTGLSAIEDPVRDEVKEAVELCQHAGVTVRMCTGDNIDTAKAIAWKCGILSVQDSNAALTGPEFRKLFCDDQEGIVRSGEFDKRLRSLRVLARCSPLDKQLLVGNLMLNGDVVAVTGDGTNDAPALKLADVGFAMEIGTGVAKKASNIILLDNNFVSVVKACKWGRNVNDNIRKFVQFQFTVNVVLLCITFVGSVADAAANGKGKAPLAPVHLLWANLIMDSMAAVALSTEQPNEMLMKRLPTYRASPLISRRMWRFIFGSSLYQLAVCLFLIFAADPENGPDIFSLKGDKISCAAEDYVTYVRELISNGTLSPASLPNETEVWTPASQVWSAQSPYDQCADTPAETRFRTLVFNTFTFMQIFNWFHARKLYDELNFFEGFGRSPHFLPIVVFTAAFQAIMVELIPQLETMCLTGGQWGTCIGLSVLMWPWGCCVRLVPIQEAKIKTTRMDQDNDEHRPGDDKEDTQTSAKVTMIRKVNAENLKLFGGKGLDECAGCAINLSQGLTARLDAADQINSWDRVRSRVRVIRAFRGARGNTGRGARHGPHAPAVGAGSTPGALSGLSPAQSPPIGVGNDSSPLMPGLKGLKTSGLNGQTGMDSPRVALTPTEAPAVHPPAAHNSAGTGSVGAQPAVAVLALDSAASPDMEKEQPAPAPGGELAPPVPPSIDPA